MNAVPVKYGSGMPHSECRIFSLEFFYRHSLENQVQYLNLKIAARSL
jgi:hypothetical protein